MSKKEFSLSLQREMRRTGISKKAMHRKTGLSLPTIRAACRAGNGSKPGPGTRMLLAVALGLPTNYFETFFPESSQKT